MNELGTYATHVRVEVKNRFGAICRFSRIKSENSRHSLQIQCWLWCTNPPMDKADRTNTNFHSLKGTSETRQHRNTSFFPTFRTISRAPPRRFLYAHIPFFRSWCLSTRHHAPLGPWAADCAFGAIPRGVWVDGALFATCSGNTASL